MKYIPVLLLILLSCNKQQSEPEQVVYTACSTSDQSSGKCERYMNRDIYFAYEDESDTTRNNVFHVQKVQDALTDFEAESGLGSGYFRFYYDDEVNLDLQNLDTFQTQIQILPDAEFNAFFAQFDGLPDPNAITVINNADKRQFFIILRESCFNNDDINCTSDGSATFSSNSGLRALIARQFGLMANMDTKDCGSYPTDVMCANFPNDDQWSTTEKNKFINSFNNALEDIANDSAYYQKLYLDTTND